MTEDDIRSVLRDMREDPVPPDSLARVRMAVNERMAAKSRMPWFAALAAVAALAMLLVMLRPHPVTVPVAPMQPPPVLGAVKPEPFNPPVRKAAVVKKLKPRPSVKREADPLVVRIETEDPDVVILLLGD